ncbi:MAG TPA: GAF domain-containing protein, partial [Anaerolineales bacterium]
MAKKSSTVRKAVKKSVGKKKSSGKLLAISDQTIEHVRGLAWTGQHAAAIDSATKALDRSRLKRDVEMSLLDLRAESYIALGKLDLAMKDARAMKKLGTTAVLKAQALYRIAFVQLWIDEAKIVIKSTNSALRAARLSKNKWLEAKCLQLLADQQSADQQIKTFQQCTGLFKSVDDQPGLADALSGLAWALSLTGQIEEARHNAQEALSISEEIGFVAGKYDALNVLAYLENDISQGLKLYKQCHQFAKATSYWTRIMGSTNNLGTRYFDLGLYPRATRYYKLCLDNLPSGYSGGSVPLSNLIHIEIEQGNLDQAHKYLTELHFKETNVNIKSFMEELSGGIALLEENPKGAIRNIKKAIQISRDYGLIREIGQIALLGDAHLAGGNLHAALKATSDAVKKHRELGFPFIEDHPSQNIWWRHALALRANKKNKEAGEALEMAYDLLLKGIESLRDHGLRRNYLNKVRINREIVQAWAKKSQKRRGGSRSAPTMPHLEVESSLREPFERLAEISLELNALKSVSEIQTFLVDEATELIGGERVMLILEKDGVREVAESILPLPSYRSGKGFEKAEDPQNVLKRIGKYLDQGRITRTVQLLTPSPVLPLKGKRAKSPSPSRRGVRSEVLNRIVAPLIAQNQVIGYLYVDMDSLYGTFEEADRDMLGMLANQGAVALDNAGLLEGLERKVEERTEELNARVDELAILNSVGEAMAKTLDVKTVTRIVGDKVRDIFNAELTTIFLFDDQTGLFHHQYYFDKTLGNHLHNIDPYPFGKGLSSQIIESGQPLLLHTAEECADHGVLLLTKIDNEYKKIYKDVKDDYVNSYLGVPIKISGKIIGVVSISDNKAYAFTESDLRLLQTLSANMGVAIQNARLFEAEQERVAELAIINSVQEALASKLDFMEILELVSDRIAQIFPKASTVTIGIIDQEAKTITQYILEKGIRI